MTTRLLDLTRSLRRSGRGVTGVDRVERAYLQRFIADDVPAFGLVRTPLGYLLLDQNGLADFYEKLEGRRPWGRAAFLSRLPRGRDLQVQQAESDLRSLAVARVRRGKLSETLRRHLPEGFDYFNVGHSNLTERVFDAIRLAGGQAHVLIHDVIPLDYPQYQRAGTVEVFRDKLKRVGQHATRVIYNSDDTRIRAEQYLQDWGRSPPSIVAHLGTIAPVPVPSEVPAHLPPDRPYLVTVGTIEPRKNHSFLLDLWDEMGPAAPPLLICGSRGWNNDSVFARLDALTPTSAVQEVPDLTDGAIAQLVNKSAGTLFPSHAEGFGLPPVEALTLGSRVLCNDLGVLREILGNKAVYAGVSERYLWINTITSWVESPHTSQETTVFSGPNWDDHFKTVLRLR